MLTTDTATRCSAAYLGVLLLSLATSAACGSPAGDSDDGFAFDDEAPADTFRGEEVSEDEALDDEPLPNDEASDRPDEMPTDPVPSDPGRESEVPSSPGGGRTSAPQPQTTGGRAGLPPTSSDGGPPPARGGPGTHDPSQPGRGGQEPPPPTPECTPGESRCVAGEPGIVEQCNATGLWETETCGTAELCTDDACTLACELAVEPSDSFVCYVPNKDGVNDGVLWVSNDPERMENGRFTGIQVHYRSDAAPAPIRRVPVGLYHDGSWPYEWKIASAGQLRQALIEFRLDQFSHLPGPLRTVDFTYWARRASSIEIPDPQVSVNYETRALAFAWEPSNGFFHTNSTHVLDYAYFAEDIRTYTILGVFGENQLDHQGGVNMLGIEITGDAFGTPPMDAFVNFAMLTVR